MNVSLAMAAGTQSPNILLIAVDDMGYDTPASFGGRVDGLTPHIDTLASQGMSFTRAYNTSSRCAPSRGSIMTGHYQDNYNENRSFHRYRSHGNKAPMVTVAIGACYGSNVMNEGVTPEKSYQVL